MLTDKLREGATGPIAKILFLLIMISFAIAGIGSYIMPKTNLNPVKVNGVSIRNSDLESQFRLKRNQLERQYGEQFMQQAKDKQFLNNLRAETLEQMINEQALSDHMFKSGIQVSKSTVKYNISKMPEFSVDGKFNNEQYRRVLSRAGYTPEMFGEALRGDIARNVYLGTLFKSNFVLPYELKIFGETFAETRNFQQLTINLDSFSKDIAVSDDEVSAYYDTHKDNFLLPEKVKLSYVFVKSDDLKPLVKYTEEDLQKYFNLHSEMFTVPEKRVIAHILLTGEDAAEKIKDIATKLANGGDFAALAKEFSEDTSSNANGGKLPALSLGKMDSSLEKAAFGLANIGDISEPVNSKFGWHIVKLLEIQPSYSEEFDKVKNTVIENYTKERVNEVYLDKRQIMIDKSFENPDSLDVAVNEANNGLEADKAVIKIQESQLLANDNSELPVPFNVDKVKATIFNKEVIESGNNSDVIDIGNSAFVVVHIDDYVAPTPKALADVKDDIVKVITANKSIEKSHEILVAILEDIKKGNSLQSYITDKLVTLSPEQSVSRKNAGSLDINVVENLFAMPKATKEGNVSVASFEPKGQAPYILVLKNVITAEQDSSLNNLSKNVLTQYNMTSDNLLLLDAARAESVIEYNTDRDYQKMIEEQQN